MADIFALEDLFREFDLSETAPLGRALVKLFEDRDGERDLSIRRTALDMAIRQSRDDHSDNVVKTAEKFFEFLSGQRQTVVNNLTVNISGPSSGTPDLKQPSDDELGPGELTGEN